MSGINKQKDSKQNEEDFDANQPLKFFGSNAESWRGAETRSGRLKLAPKYQPEIVSISVIVFLIYFCYLREENEVDEKLKRDLYDHWGEEASRLKKAYDYNIKNNLPTAEILNRLREIGAPAPPRQ